MEINRENQDHFKSCIKILKRYLTWCISLISLAIFLGSILLINISYNLAGKKIFISEVDKITLNLEKNIDLIVKEIEKKANNEDISNVLSSIGDIVTYAPYINNYYYNSVVDKMSIFNDGQVRQLDISIRPWYNEVISSGNTSDFIAVHSDMFTNNETISLVTKVKDKDNNIVGLITIDIYMESLKVYLESYTELEGIKVNVIGTNNYSTYTSNSIDRLIFDDKVKVNFQYDNSYNSIVRTKEEVILWITAYFIILTSILIYIGNMVIKKIFYRLSKDIEFMTLNYSEYVDELNDIRGIKKIKKIINIFIQVLKDRNRELNSLLYTDSLTGVPNKYFLELEVNKLISKSKEFGIVCFNIKDFKYINNIYGSKVGDELLKIVAKNIEDNVLKNGIVARFSADKFAAIYVKDKENEIYSLIEDSNINMKNSMVIKVNGLDITTKVVIGCAFYPKDGIDYADLVNKCYFVIDDNKKNRNNENIFFNKRLFDENTRKVQIRSKIKDAVHDEEFKIYIQPIHNDFNIVKCEVLLRWFSKEFGYVYPDEFIRYAEETGDIIILGYWVIEESFKAYNIIKNKVKTNIEFGINISGIQLYQKDFTDIIEELSCIYNINTSEVIFELTESVLIYGNEIAHINISRLKVMGFKIALDDFGTGYSSLSYLEQFKIDIIKIDKSFIDNKSKESEFGMVKGLIKFFQYMNIKVVVEGVETIEQLEILKASNCDYYQGYYFSKPITIENFIKYANNINVKNL